MRVRLAKTGLWFLLGLGLTVILMRLIHGPGSVVALTDLLPWGLWKGGGVVALVQIGGAGFTLAAFVYIFHWGRYKPLAVGAVLLGLMCYSSVGAGLTVDIGIWWRIVFPTVYWQFHSTLFEIAWCIMLYLGVLAGEFGQIVTQRLGFERVHRLLARVSLALVIVGISLSTLHQSSLGTLFLATPYRLHALWYSDLLPLFFFITSIGLGCLTITWVALVVHRLYHTEPPMVPVAGLARISSYVLGLYLALRLGEIALVGKAPLLLQPSWDTANFWVEILLSAAIPVVLMSRRAFRERPTAMLWISACAIAGFALHRVNVAGLATLGPTRALYFPAWTEWAVLFGILSAAGLFYLFCVEHFPVFPAIDRPAVARASLPGAVDPADWKTIFFRNPLAEARVYSIAFVLAVGLAFAVLPRDAVFGVEPERTHAQRPRRVELAVSRNTDLPGSRYFVPGASSSIPSDAETHLALLIDGNRSGEYVLFDHELHVARVKERSDECTACHHMRKPYEKVSLCSDCHADMYLPVDVFRHSLHAEAMGGNSGCAQCHPDATQLKVRANVLACESCHRDMRAASPIISRPEDPRSSLAVGYMQAMHGLCVTCHEREQAKISPAREDLARCANCHRDTPLGEPPRPLGEGAPKASRLSQAASAEGLSTPEGG